MTSRRITIASALAAAFLLLNNGSAFADKPEWAGGPNHGREHRKERHDDRRDDPRERSGGYLAGADRQSISEYYRQEAARGRCPPGLARKHNGCMPPGQAKKLWAVGRPLPAGVVYYDLPQPVLLRLPPPPPRHRYVQVAGDVLLIAVGTSMVVDALDDLLR